MSMNLLSTLNKKNYILRRSARLSATRGIIDVGGESLDGSRGVQTSKRKRAASNDASVAINRPPLERQSEPEVHDSLAPNKKRTLKKEHIDPAHENTRPSKRKRGPHLEPVYIIPDLEKKKTTFRGRLGEHLQLHSTSLHPHIRRLCMSKYRYAK